MQTFQQQQQQHYFYLLPFQGTDHFKIGISSGLSYARIQRHVRSFRIDPKESILIFGDQSEIADLEWILKNEYSAYNRAEEVTAIYGPFDGYTEVLSKSCLEEVKAHIELWKQNPGCSFKITHGLSLKGIFTDNNIDQTQSRDEVKLAEYLPLTDLYQKLSEILTSGQVTRVNSGYNKKVSYFALHYLIEAEHGFNHALFDKQFTQKEIFHFGTLEIEHQFYSGQKLRSSGTYLSGSIYLVRVSELKQITSRGDDIKAINSFLESLSNHAKRDVNFKVKITDSSKSRLLENFQSYQAGQRVCIGKTLEGPDTQLW